MLFPRPQQVAVMKQQPFPHTILPPTLPPWPDPDQWQAVNRVLAGWCRTAGPHSAGVRAQARRIEAGYRTLFPLMDDWCRITCPTCPEICCRMARIWFDFNDLLFLHSSGLRIPKAQLLDRFGGICRCLGPGGCLLPRHRRPWRCLRFFCRRQESLLKKMPAAGRIRFYRQVAVVEGAREAMAAFFYAAGGEERLSSPGAQTGVHGTTGKQGFERKPANLRHSRDATMERGTP
jgi:hypothetical protein